VTRLKAGRRGFDSWQKQGMDFFLFATVSKLTLDPIQIPMKWVLVALSLGIKWSGHGAGTRLSLVLMLMHGAILPPSIMSSWWGAELSEGYKLRSSEL
jgi:hypothetical protein